MNKPKRIILVRHGESQRNKAKEGSVHFENEEARKSIAGIPDCEIQLTEKGHEQALKTGVGLRTEFGLIDYFYDSGYKRTIQTRENILKAYSKKELSKIQVRSNFLLRERDNGYTYDMTAEEVKKYFPWLQSHFDTFGRFMARPPGGESIADVAMRASQILEMIFTRRVGDDVCIICHGGTIMAIRYLLEKWNYQQAIQKENISTENCGITVYEYCSLSKKLELKYYNKIYY